MIRGWLARIFHKVEGEEVEVTNFCFDTIDTIQEGDQLLCSSFVATRDMVGVLCVDIANACVFNLKIYHVSIRGSDLFDNRRS